MKLFPDDLRFVFGHSRYADHERFGPLHGCQIEMVYLRSGDVEVMADGVDFSVTAPAVLFVASSQMLEYRYGGSEPAEVLWCQCLGPSISASLIASLRRLNRAGEVTEVASTLFRLGAELPLRVNDDLPDLVASLAETLAQELVGRSAAGIQPQKSEGRVMVIARYLEDNLEQDIAMGDLAETFALTPQHINRLFRATHGVNALDYLWSLRLRRGAFMLRHTAMPISQIAYKNGFKTPNHFSRLIGRQFGLSPRKLRQREWLGEG